MTRFSLGTVLLILTFIKCATLTVPSPKPENAKNITEIGVSLEHASFNPSLKKTLAITIVGPVGYHTKVTINDAHGLVIKTLYDKVLKQSKGITLSWDGTDDSGMIVPDEAYYPIVQARKEKDTLIYNPPLFSGGETFTITEADYNIAKGIITYNLEKNSRVIIRAGEKKGVLLKSIAHCAPRLKGQVTEYWNGKDADGLLSIKDLPTWALIIAGYTLPDNAIITYGNKNIDYWTYFQKRFPEFINTREFPNTSRQFKETIAKMERKVNLHYTYPLAKDMVPELHVAFPNAPDSTENGSIKLQGMQRVYIDINPDNKLFYRNQQFELCFFIDGKFVSEDEIGYVPYNWIWNTAEVSEGEHIVTINISSFKDQIGTKSVKVFVQH